MEYDKPYNRINIKTLLERDFNLNLSKVMYFYTHFLIQMHFD